MRLWERALSRFKSPPDPQRSMSVDEYFKYLGHVYNLGVQQSIVGDKEEPPDTYSTYGLQLLGSNPIVSAASDIRVAVFAQGTLRYQSMNDGRVENDPAFRRVREPWPGGSESRLLAKMIVQADLGGNSYVINHGDRLWFLRPDWTTVVLGSQRRDENPIIAEDAEILGYIYDPPGGEREFYPRAQVAHFMPKQDPLAQYRGMSWMTPIIQEVRADKQATRHKLKFFEQGATPNLIIKFDPSINRSKIKAFKELIEEKGGGVEDAYETLYLGGGADATVVGSNFQQLEFAALQGKAETRILMAAGVHPVIAGASEGMQGASLNAGNFKQIRRLFSDIHLQWLWTEAAAALQTILPRRQGKKLIVSGHGMPFLQDDAQDQAEIHRLNAIAISTYVREGYTWDSARDTVKNNDIGLLKHTGVLSVQLQGDNGGSGSGGNGSGDEGSAPGSSGDDNGSSSPGDEGESNVSTE